MAGGDIGGQDGGPGQYSTMTMGGGGDILPGETLSKVGTMSLQGDNVPSLLLAIAQQATVKWLSEVVGNGY